MDPVATDPKSVSLVLAPIMSITLQAEDGITISADSKGVVKVWDLSTGHCRASFQTPAKEHECSGAQLINDRLIFGWYADQKIHIWDSEKGALQIVDGTWGRAEDVRISGDGSRISCLRWECVETWSILTGEHVVQVELELAQHKRSLSIDGSRVWVHSPIEKCQGWDFGIPGSSPVQLSIIPPPHFSITKSLDYQDHRIKNIATGKVVFQLGGRFARPVDPHWSGQYLVAGYASGEMLILDFDHVFPKW